MYKTYILADENSATAYQKIKVRSRTGEKYAVLKLAYTEKNPYGIFEVYEYAEYWCEEVEDYQDGSFRIAEFRTIDNAIAFMKEIYGIKRVTLSNNN